MKFNQDWECKKWVKTINVLKPQSQVMKKLNV